MRTELRWVLALLPLAAAFLDAPWSDTVTAVDASEAGFGVCEANWGHEQAGEVGALRERSCFRGPLAPSATPRERALEVELRLSSVGAERGHSSHGGFGAGLRRGQAVISWDASRNDCFDLRRDEGFNVMRGGILAGKVWGLRCGTTCGPACKAGAHE